MIAAAITTTVRPTSQSENPYMPTWYETLRSLNHDACCSNCSPFEKSKRASASIQKPTSTSATSAPNDATARPPKGKTKQASPPATGRKIRIVTIHESTSAHRDEDDDEDGEAAGERERVRAEEPGLEAADGAAGLLRLERDAGPGAEDQRPLDPAVPGARGPDGGLVEDGVVELVEPELVLEQPLQLRDARHGDAARSVDRPRDRDADEPEPDGEDAGNELLRPARVDERRRGRLEEVRDRRPERCELDPAADDRQHREDRDGHQHGQRAVLAVGRVVVFPRVCARLAPEDEEEH